MDQYLRRVPGAEVTPRHKVNNDIETLRAVAILFVLFHHFGFLVVGARAYDIYWHHFGLWSGVDLFFAISGYVIAKSYYERFAGAGTENLALVSAAFWIRRIFRLWPSAWLWLALSVWQATNLGIARFWANFSDAVSAVLEVANFHWWACLGNQSACGAVGLYWSLSLEEQFYMLFPLLFLLPRRLHLWLLLSIAAIQAPIPRLPWAHDILWFTRTDAIALGVCVYLLSRSTFYQQVKPAFLNSKRVALATGCGVVMLLAAVTEPQQFPDRAIVPFATGMVAVVSAVLVLIASYDGDWLFNIPVVRPVMLWIGARSYALYLVQAFAFEAIHNWASKRMALRLPPGPWLLVATGIATFALMAVLAELNFRLIENPLRRKGAEFAGRFYIRYASP